MRSIPATIASYDRSWPGSKVMYTTAVRMGTMSLVGISGASRKALRYFSEKTAFFLWMLTLLISRW